MSIKEKLTKVIEIFNRLPSSDIASESKWKLKDAAKEIVRLQTEIESDEELKKTADIIIAGAIIYAMAINDNKYNNSALYFGDEHMYSRLPSEVFSGFREGMDLREKLVNIGTRALITKDLPFTGIFDQTFFNGVFSALSPILTQEHFAPYHLNSDPSTMDPTAINQPGKEKRKAAQEDQKWKTPFGLKSRYPFEGNEFETRKSTIKGLIAEEDRQHSVALWKWRGFVLLACLVAPLTAFISLIFTIPWLKNRYKGIQTEYNNRTWVKTEFTREEYDGIREQKRALKDTFTEEVVKNPKKPHKICIGLDFNGKETSKREDIKKVVMLCDKAQAKRWSPAFIKKATQSSYNETIEQSSAYNPN